MANVCVTDADVDEFARRLYEKTGARHPRSDLRLALELARIRKQQADQERRVAAERCGLCYGTRDVLGDPCPLCEETERSDR